MPTNKTSRHQGNFHRNNRVFDSRLKSSDVHHPQKAHELKIRKNGSLPDAAERRIHLAQETDRFETLKGAQKKASVKKQRALSQKIKAEVQNTQRIDRINVVLRMMLLVLQFLSLVKVYQRNSGKIPPAGKKEPNSNKPFSGTQPNPDFMIEHRNNTGIAYDIKYNAELFSKFGAHMYDVVQGQAGDCYILAALAAVANKTNNYIEQMITINDDGTYNVRLFYRDSSGEYHPTKIHVDQQLPMFLKTNKEVYARAFDSDANSRPEIWAPIIEKAFAKFAEKYDGISTAQGTGYETIGQGGWSHEALAVITGNKGTSLRTPSLSNQEIIDVVSKANDGHYVVAGSGRGSATVPGSHAYSIQGVRQDGENYLIELRNPWGRMGGSPSQDGHGVFELTLEEFRALFRSLYFAEKAAVNVFKT